MEVDERRQRDHERHEERLLALAARLTRKQIQLAQDIVQDSKTQSGGPDLPLSVVMQAVASNFAALLKRSR